MFIQNVFFRDEILENLIKLCKIAAKETLEDVPTQDAFVDFLLRIVRNNKVQMATLERFVYSPMKQLFTFG